ncbi:hypothetical protein vseg_016261 [Gypsophila vaccaria]
MNVMGVNNNGKIMKNRSRNKGNIRRKKRVNFVDKIPGIINYLTSDFYLYSPLLSFSSSSRLNDVRFSGMEKNEAILREDGGKLKEKLVNYLKSDAYLYSPLGNVRHRDDVTVKNVISPPRAQEVPFTRVTSTVLSKKIAWQTKQVSYDSMGDLGKGGGRDRGTISPPTPVIPDGKKPATRRRVVI